MYDFIKRENVVSIVIGILRNRGSNPDRDLRLIASPNGSDRLWCLRVSYSMGNGLSFAEVMGPRSERDNSPLPSAEVKNEYSYNFTSPHACMACAETSLPLSVSKQRYFALYILLAID
jgi:hypothetical protein